MPLGKRKSPKGPPTAMSVSSLSLSCVSASLISKVSSTSHSHDSPRAFTCPSDITLTFPREALAGDRATNCGRRMFLLGVGTIMTAWLPATSLLAQEVPQNYSVFIDDQDGYSYYYPSDWRDFDFRGHDSAFKDRYLQLQNVRVRFIPTDKKDIHDMGPMEEVVYDLVEHIYAAPNQFATILSMEERTVDGKNYYTFEYGLSSPNYATTSFATVAVANGRYYTLITAANERRWRRVRSKLKVIADSFKVFDI